MAILKFLPDVNSITILPSETLRYMGVGCSPSPAEEKLARTAAEKVYAAAVPQVCYALCPVIGGENYVDLGFGKIQSQSLEKLLENCETAVVFAATSGIGTDRLIASRKAVSITDALAADAASTVFVESLCDSFCEFIDALYGKNGHLTMRFSPGYGDLPLNLQKDIFGFLDCPRNIGLTLTDSLLMIPSKSVTAIMGIGTDTQTNKCNHSCKTCSMKTCIYRKEEL